jgi:hypothetical protein
MQLSIYLGFRVHRSANRDESGGIGESLDCSPQCSDGRAAPFTSFSSFHRTQSCARTTQHAGQGTQACIVTKRPTTQAPLDAQLSAAPVLHLPASFPGAPLLSAVCL